MHAHRVVEKSTDPRLRASFEQMAHDARTQRDRIQVLLSRLTPTAGYYLTQEDKLGEGRWPQTGRRPG